MVDRKEEANTTRNTKQVEVDRVKHLLVQEQYPDLDIRFLFQNAYNKIHKKSKTRYCDWCDKYGFQWTDKEIPKKWLTEKKKRVQLGVLNRWK